MICGRCNKKIEEKERGYVILNRVVCNECWRWGVNDDRHKGPIP